MKTLLIISLSVLLTFPAVGQIHWLTPGAMWTYDISGYAGYGLNKLEVTQTDTAFGTHICRKILSTTIFVTGNIYTPVDTIIETIYAYEENNVVYGYEPNIFPYWMVLYDFNKIKGDTLEFMFFGGQSPYPFVVDSVGIMEMNGTTFTFQDISFPDIFQQGQYSKIRVIQGLGSINSYFFHIHTILYPFDAAFYYFRCYEDPNIGVINLSDNQVDCDYFEGITSIPEVTTVKTSVYPNPSNNLVTLISEDQLIAKIYVVDLLGKFRIIEEQIAQSSFTIDISALENGMYYIIGVNKIGKIFVTKKIAKFGS